MNTITDITVIPLGQQYQFRFNGIRYPNLGDIFDQGWSQAIEQLPKEAPWSIAYVNGNGNDSAGVGDNFGRLEWIIGLAKGGLSVGYVTLKYAPMDNAEINVIENVSIIVDLPLRDLVRLIQAAVNDVKNSSTAHLFNQPFGLKRTWRMGAISLRVQ